MCRQARVGSNLPLAPSKPTCLEDLGRLTHWDDSFFPFSVACCYHSYVFAIEQRPIVSCIHTITHSISPTRILAVQDSSKPSLLSIQRAGQTRKGKKRQAANDRDHMADGKQKTRKTLFFFCSEMGGVFVREDGLSLRVGTDRARTTREGEIDPL